MALNLIGVMHLAGEGCQQDAVIASQCFETAAHKGCVDAMVNMGALFELGTAGWTRDPKRAVEWYTHYTLAPCNTHDV